MLGVSSADIESYNPSTGENAIVFPIDRSQYILRQFQGMLGSYICLVFEFRSWRRLSRVSKRQLRGVAMIRRRVFMRMP